MTSPNHVNPGCDVTVDPRPPIDDSFRERKTPWNQNDEPLFTYDQVTDAICFFHANGRAPTLSEMLSRSGHAFMTLTKAEKKEERR